MPAQLQEAYTRAVGRFLVVHGIEFVAVGEWANKMFEGIPEVQRLQCGTIPHPSYFLPGFATTEDFEDLKISLGNIFSKVLDEEVQGPDMTRRARRGNSIWEGSDHLLSSLGLFGEDQRFPLGLVPHEKMSEFMKMSVDDGNADEAVQDKVIAAFKDVCRDGGLACWDSQQAYSAAANLDTPLPLNFLGSEAVDEATARPPASQKEVDKVVTAFQDVCREGGRNNPNAWINDMQFESLVQVRFLLTFPPKLYTDTRLALPRSVFVIGAYLAK